jgi:GWxTD domain-containing protein
MHLSRIGYLLAFLAVFIHCLMAADTRKKLLPQYQEWLEGPASLLITKPERDAFDLLASDVQRDAFIEHFWAIRNPSPGNPTNEFKEEFDSRVSFANAFYGRDAGTEGWRTDRGRTYILFGKPRTSMSFLANQELYPTEMWFYSNPGLSELPPFFYVIFFEKDGISGYRLYNPVTDGPDKIMRAGPSKAQAFQYLRQLNSELAQAMLTLIPGEMVDTESYSGSMASMAVINAIRSYREMPSYQRLISERTRRFEQVTTKLTYDSPSSSLQTFVALQNGDYWLHWRFEVQDPLQPKVKAGRVDFRIRAQLFSKGQLVYERTDAPGFTVPGGQEEALEKRPFAYEERFPVVPGEYRLYVSAENRVAGRSYESERTFQVGEPGKRTYLSELLLAAKRGPDSRQVPFEFAGLRFDLLAGGKVLRSQPLRVLYQIRPADNAGSEWNMEFIIGSVNNKQRKTFEEKVVLDRPDSGGASLVTTTLATEDLPLGSYILAMRLRNSGSGEVHGRSVQFQVISKEEDRPIVIARPVQTGAQAAAALHYEKSLCWLSQQRPQEALREAKASWRLSQTEAARQLMEVLKNQVDRLVSK